MLKSREHAMRVSISTRLVFLSLILVISTAYEGLSTVGYHPSVSGSWWNKEWKFREEIEISIDTSDPYSIYQPIDMRIAFKERCWAINETINSVRVCCLYKGKWYELESQIYNLEFDHENIISSCRVVFLVPSFADGTERYYVYYDDSEKEKTNYPDHVTVEKGYYYYAPLPAYPFKSDYYGIREDGSIVYAVSLDGEFLGSGTTQQITKLKSNISELCSPKDADAWASFDFFYYYGNDICKYSSTFQKFVSSEILVDGNLMAKFYIESESYNRDFKTRVIYTYYYCPSSTKKIYVQVKHEALKECHVADKYPFSESCGNIGGLQTVKFSSSSIRELNFGKMFPFTHVFGETGDILEYKMDMDPEYSAESIRLISKKDDVDLGERAWASFDEGESGEAHAIIISTNKGIVYGTDERDGIQINLYEASLPNMLGLEIDGQSYFFSRNSYEVGEVDDLVIPEDFVCEYYAEFFSTYDGGYRAVDNESRIFQKLSKLMFSDYKFHTGVEKEKEGAKYNLKVCLHFAPSIPLGSVLSMISGKKIPYVVVELYHQTDMISSGTAGRVFFNIHPITGSTFVEKLKSVVSLLDLEKLSLFKSSYFQGLKPGTYLIKVYLQNPIITKNRLFLGYKIVNLNKDAVVHILCGPPVTIYVRVRDQYGKGIQNSKVILYEGNTSISSALVDTDGTAKVSVPLYVHKKFRLAVWYKGFRIYEKEIKLGLRNLFRRKIIYDVKEELYDLEVYLKDYLGCPLEVDAILILTSDLMEEKIEIRGGREEVSKFIFQDLPSSEYVLKVIYGGGFSISRSIKLDRNREISLEVPILYNIALNIFDVRGYNINDVNILLFRRNVTLKMFSGEGRFLLFLPPGKYKLYIYHNSKLIAKRPLDVIGRQNIDMVTKEELPYPWVILFVILAIVFLVGSIIIKRAGLLALPKVLTFLLCAISLTLPWWTLEGYNPVEDVKIISKIFTMPPSLTTIALSEDIIAGEFVSSGLPDIFVHLLILIVVMSLIGGILVFLSSILRRKLFFIILGSFLLFTSIIMFYYMVSTLTKVGIGSFYGEGILDMSMPGKKNSVTFFSRWGPDVGFGLSFLSLVSALFSLTMDIKTNRGRQKCVKRKNVLHILKKIMPLIGIVILFYIIVDIGPSKIIATFASLDPLYIIISSTLTLPLLLIRNFAWQRIQKLQNIHMSFWRSFRITLIGYFYAAVTPGYIGQLMRVPYMKEVTGEPVGKLFVNNFIEAVIRTFVLFIMAVFGALLIASKVPNALPSTLLVLAAFIAFYGIFASKERGETILNLLGNLFIPKRLRPIFLKFIGTFYKDFPKISKLLIPLIIEIPTWIILYTQLYIIGVSLDINVPYTHFLLLYPIANLISFIPITSAGLGTREASLIFMFSLYGIPPEKTLVLSLSGYIITDLLTGLYGFILSAVEMRSYKRDLGNLEMYMESLAGNDDIPKYQEGTK